MEKMLIRRAAPWKRRLLQVMRKFNYLRIDRKRVFQGHWTWVACDDPHFNYQHFFHCWKIFFDFRRFSRKEAIQNPLCPFSKTSVCYNMFLHRNCFVFIKKLFGEPFLRFSQPSSVVGRKVTASRSEGEKSAPSPAARIDASHIKGGQVLAFWCYLWVFGSHECFSTKKKGSLDIYGK